MGNSGRTGIRVSAIKHECQAKYDGAKFAGIIRIGGSVVGYGFGSTKSEARSEAKRTAEEMGIWTDGIGWIRS